MSSSNSWIVRLSLAVGFEIVIDIVSRVAEASEESANSLERAKPIN